MATIALATPGGHPFYQRLHHVLDTHQFDEFVEAQCAAFYATTIGRPSLTPGTYVRLLLLIGSFEGIDSERGIAWRAGRFRHPDPPRTDHTEAPGTAEARESILASDSGSTAGSLSSQIAAVARIRLTTHR